mmetsp:Transcript_82482/g.229956  ORF Transcript_82482/g.229956 Transcript_82482/m.229956 type:complete len:222 (+) Transcript_82482:315-980(+)
MSCELRKLQFLEPYVRVTDGTHPTALEDVVQKYDGVRVLALDGTDTVRVLHRLQEESDYCKQRNGKQHARHAPDLVEEPNAQDNNHGMYLYGNAEEDRLNEEVDAKVSDQLQNERDQYLPRRFADVNDREDARKRRGGERTDARQKIGQKSEQAEGRWKVEAASPQEDEHQHASEGRNDALHLEVAARRSEHLLRDAVLLHSYGTPQHVQQENKSDDRLQG